MPRLPGPGSHPWRLLFSAGAMRGWCDVLGGDRAPATNQPGAMASARVGLGVAPAGPRVGQGAFTQCALLSGGGGPARRCPRQRHDEGQPPFAGLWRASPPPRAAGAPPAALLFLAAGGVERQMGRAGVRVHLIWLCELGRRGLPDQVLRQSTGWCCGWGSGASRECRPSRGREQNWGWCGRVSGEVRGACKARAGD